MADIFYIVLIDICAINANLLNFGYLDEFGTEELLFEFRRSRLTNVYCKYFVYPMPTYMIKRFQVTWN